jgi:glutaredoxin 3
MTCHIIVGRPGDPTHVPPIVIYTKSSCPYCHAAKDLLRRKGAKFEEISVDGDRAGQAAMAARAGGRSSVPQIFIGAAHVGGCDDLHALDASGGLDPLLAA